MSVSYTCVLKILYNKSHSKTSYILFKIFLLKIKMTWTFLNPVHWSHLLFQIFQHNVVQVWTLQKRIKWCLTYFGKKDFFACGKFKNFLGQVELEEQSLLFLDLRSCPQDPSDNSVLLVEKAMAPHSSTLVWKIPWTEEPGGLQSMGSLGVGHDWATSLSLFTFMHWRRKWQPTPVFLPGEPQGRGSLVDCHLWGRTESDTTEAT